MNLSTRMNHMRTSHFFLLAVLVGATVACQSEPSTRKTEATGPTPSPSPSVDPSPIQEPEVPDPAARQLDAGARVKHSCSVKAKATGAVSHCFDYEGPAQAEAIKTEFQLCAKNLGQDFESVPTQDLCAAGSFKGVCVTAAADGSKVDRSFHAEIFEETAKDCTTEGGRWGTIGANGQITMADAASPAAPGANANPPAGPGNETKDPAAQQPPENKPAAPGTDTAAKGPLIKAKVQAFLRGTDASAGQSCTLAVGTEVQLLKPVVAVTGNAAQAVIERAATTNCAVVKGTIFRSEWTGL
jgi:hypothetical protein